MFPRSSACTDGPFAVVWIFRWTVAASLSIALFACDALFANGRPASFIRIDKPSGIYLVGEPVELQVVSVFQRPPDPGKQVTVMTESETGETWSENFQFDPQAGVRQEFSFSLPNEQPGFFRLTLNFEGEPLGEPDTVSIVPPPAKIDPPFEQAMFGAAFFKDMEAARRIGVRFVRTLVHWKYTELTPGRYSWTEIETLIKGAEENDIGVILTAVVRSAPDWARWTSPAELVRSEHTPHYRSFIRAVTERLATSKVDGALEIQNEPDISLQWVNKLDIDTSAVTAAYLLREGAAEARKVDSQIPILAMGVSGMDFRAGLPLSNQALATTTGVADYLAQHPYTQKRFVGDASTFDWPSDYPMVAYWDQAKALAQAHSRNGQVWSTELGWGVDASQDQLSADNQTLASVLVRAMATSFGEGIEKFCWFGGQLEWQEKGRRFSLFYKKGGEWRPTIAAGAYANCARLLEGAQPAGRLDVHPDLIAYHFMHEAPGRQVIVLWAKNKPVKLAAMIGKGVTEIDILGRERELSPGHWQQEVTSRPIYIVADGGPDALPRHYSVSMTPAK